MLRRLFNRADSKRVTEVFTNQLGLFVGQGMGTKKARALLDALGEPAKVSGDPERAFRRYYQTPGLKDPHLCLVSYYNFFGGVAGVDLEGVEWLFSRGVDPRPFHQLVFAYPKMLELLGRPTSHEFFGRDAPHWVGQLEGVKYRCKGPLGIFNNYKRSTRFEVSISYTPEKEGEFDRPYHRDTAKVGFVRFHSENHIDYRIFDELRFPDVRR